MPGTARWLGKVLRPLARSSADCESAAQAVLSFASSRAAAIAGSYAAINPAADVWPGDVLSITANGQTLNVVVRQVSIVDGNAVPELLTYRIAFANDWAESLGVTLSEAIAPDSFLPPTAEAAPGTVLANLQQLTVASATASALQIDAGDQPAHRRRLRSRACATGTSAPASTRTWCCAARSAASPSRARRRWSVTTFACSTPRTRRSTRGSPAPSSQTCRSLEQAADVTGLSQATTQHRNTRSSKMTDFEGQVLADLSVLKSQMEEVLGNGQPGRLSLLECRMLEHEKIVQRLKGMAAAFGALLTIAHVAIDFFIGRH